jgi:hypothetical protein
MFIFSRIGDFFPSYQLKISDLWLMLTAQTSIAVSITANQKRENHLLSGISRPIYTYITIMRIISGGENQYHHLSQHGLKLTFCNVPRGR